MRVGPKSSDCYPHKKRKGLTEIHTEKSIGRQKQSLEPCSGKLRNSTDCWKPLEASKGPGKILLQNLQKEYGLEKRSFWTSTLQNWERINFYHLKPPVCDTSP